jgi:mono/diheme cytochrome c family protein
MIYRIQDFRVTGFAAQALFLAVPLSYAPPQAGTQTAKSSAAGSPTAVIQSTDRAPSSKTKVIQVYRSACLKCHDVDGRGEVVREVFAQVPNFTDSKWHASRSDAELSRSILEGKGKSMPKMKDKLGPVDVKEMLAFVRAFSDGKQVVPEEPEDAAGPEKPAPRATTSPPGARGAEAALANRPGPAQRTMDKNFQKLCTMCHAAAGDGSRAKDTMPAIPDFTNIAWQGKRSDPQLAVSILDGKGTEMPPFRGKLSRDQVRGLVAFIRGFSRAPKKPAQTSVDDFEARFRALERELNDLRQQSQALSLPASRGPASPARAIEARPSPPPDRPE